MLWGRIFPLSEVILPSEIIALTNWTHFYTVEGKQMISLVWLHFKACFWFFCLFEYWVIKVISSILQYILVARKGPFPQKVNLHSTSEFEGKDSLLSWWTVGLGLSSITSWSYQPLVDLVSLHCLSPPILKTNKQNLNFFSGIAPGCVFFHKYFIELPIVSTIPLVCLKTNDNTFFST